MEVLDSISLIRKKRFVVNKKNHGRERLDPHFTEEETEVQQDKVTWPRLWHIRQM